MNNACGAVAKDSDTRVDTVEKSLTSAILGVAPVSHGMKLPPHMDSEEKSKLMLNFEVWRQARIEKLTQRILGKGKNMKNTKPSGLPQPKPKTSNLATKTDVKQGHCDGKKNVFDRLYEKPVKNNVTKESEEIRNGKLNSVRKQQALPTGKPLFGQNREKKRKTPKVIVTCEAENVEVTSELSSKGVESNFVAEEIISELVENVQNTEVNCEMEKTNLKMEEKIYECQIPILDDAESAKGNVIVQDNKTVSDDITVLEKEKATHASEERVDINVTEETGGININEEMSGINVTEEKADINVTEEMGGIYVIEEMGDIYLTEEMGDINVIEVEEADYGTEEREDFNNIEEQADSDTEERRENVIEEKACENETGDRKECNVFEEKVTDKDTEGGRDENAIELEEVDIGKQLKESESNCKKGQSFVKKGKPFKCLPRNKYRPKPNTSLRRTSSMTFHNETDKKAIQRANSDWSLHEIKDGGEVEELKIVQKNKNGHREVDSSSKNVVDGQSVKEKKSVCFLTPRPSALSAFHMRNNLENWLTANGHSIDTYRHLRCFGLSAEKTPRPPQYRQQKLDESLNTSFYSTAPNTPMPDIVDESDKENVTPPVPAPRVEKVDPKVVEGWLSDLHSLIVHVKYPSDRCEEWLNAIAKKFPNCTQLAIYWECLAAMGVSCRDNPETENNEDKMTKNDEVGEELAELLDQLVIDEKCGSVSKTERGLSAKNIFTSKTVKFALKEKTMKQVDPALGTEACQKVLVATPVRRSARVRIPDKSNVITSLKSLDPDVRRSLSFKPNEALFTG